MSSGGNVLGGKCPGGGNVLWGKCPRGKCPRGEMPGGNCPGGKRPGGKRPGGKDLESFTFYYKHRSPSHLKVLIFRGSLNSGHRSASYNRTNSSDIGNKVGGIAFFLGSASGSS